MASAGHSDDCASLKEALTNRFGGPHQISSEPHQLLATRFGGEENDATPTDLGEESSMHVKPHRFGGEGHDAGSRERAGGEAPDDWPGLVLIDGGKGQLHAVLSALPNGLEVDLLGTILLPCLEISNTQPRPEDVNLTP